MSEEALSDAARSSNRLARHPEGPSETGPDGADWRVLVPFVPAVPPHLQVRDAAATMAKDTRLRARRTALMACTSATERAHRTSLAPAPLTVDDAQRDRSGQSDAAVGTARANGVNFVVAPGRGFRVQAVFGSRGRLHGIERRLELGGAEAARPFEWGEEREVRLAPFQNGDSINSLSLDTPAS